MEANRTMKRAVFTVLQCSGLLGVAFHSVAQGIVDQHVDDYPTSGLVAESSMAVGQEFFPTLPSVSFVEFNIWQSETASSIARIRNDTIDGSLLGVSAPILGRTYGESRYNFASPIPLIPGNRYVIELDMTVPEGLDTVLLGPIPVPIGAGRMIVFGAASDGESWWFREGTIVPEPSAFALFLLTAIIWFASRGHRMFVSRELATRARRGGGVVAGDENSP